MISRLLLRNFQTHKRLLLELGPGVTTIVGPSDVGKSAVVRALTWLALGEPRGSAFMRKGSKRALVSLTVDGKRIRRVRGKASIYLVGSQRLAACGVKVPDEVSSRLNLNRINFQCQHDPAFWFSSSPGQVSKELNKIVDLEDIDTTLANLASMHRDARAEARVVEDRLEEATKEARALRFAKRLGQEFRSCQRAEQKAASAAQTASTLRNLVEQAVKLQATADRLCQRAQASRKVTKAQSAWRRAHGSLRGLLLLLNEERDWGGKLAELPGCETLQSQANEVARLYQEQQGLREILKQIEDLEYAHDEASQYATALEIDLAKIKECPACQRPF